ncbi:MAG: phosphoribosylformylglycinamidine synthase [Candidatus Pelagibacter sp.]|nr:phosphoribosylformylglycinamidine synthase [Candidatus Pelagibacter sp.]OUV87334.1 MAG: phosphoribosylformylglycinamidine synthase [Pelagibacteraceae bacterium TMED136]
MKFEVFVTLKNGVLDPQGKAVENALGNIGLSSIKNVRQGKYFTIEVDEHNEEKAKTLVKSSCEKLLANETIENFKFNKIQ